MHSAQDYEALVARLTHQADNNPSRYKLKLGLLAAAGFAVLGGSLGLALALAAVTVVLMAAGKSIGLIKIGLLALAFAWMILRSLFIRFAPPEGVPLGFDDAPALSAQIERIRLAAGAPPLEGVVLTNELNAAAASVPRLLGLLGSRHYLVIGLPLMQRLDRDQFAAVLAHEFGHFGGGHSHFAGWIYRVRASWYRVCDGFEQAGSWAGRPLLWFFKWYAPYFNAYSFVLARQNEYQADAAAARLVGAGPAAQALVSIELASLRLERDFWPGVNRSARGERDPPRALYQQIGRDLLTPGTDDAGRLAEILRREGGLEDTHPVLARRLAALGQQAQLPAIPETSAADALLGDFHAPLAERFSVEWHQSVGEDWQALFDTANAQRARLQALEQAWQSRPAEADERIVHACLVADLRGDVEAKPLLASALLETPDHAEAQFRYGNLLLAASDPAGEAHLERAMALDRDYAQAGLERLRQWHVSREGVAAASVFEERLRALDQSQQGDHRERSLLEASDVFLAHGLDEAERLAIGRAMRPIKGIASLWIVRKQLHHDDRLPHYVVLVKWHMFSHATDVVLGRIAKELPLQGTWLVVVKDALGRKTKAYQGAAGEPVYQSG